MLKSLELENFRNYKSQRLDFRTGSGLTYLIGENGQGKTNLLEAVYLLALGKSFRLADDEGLIGWEGDFARVKGVFGGEGRGREDQQLEVFLGRAPQARRVFKVNEVKTAAGEFLGRLKVVFFHPEDLNMLYLGPDLRRRYLDILLIQRDSVYFRALRNFKRLKEQRNALLTAIRERTAREADLDVWDQQLVENGVVLWRERAAALEFIDKNLSDEYGNMSGGNDALRCGYRNSLGLDFSYVTATANLAPVYDEALRKSRSRDIASGHTQIGPHRDDLEFFLNEKPIQTHASRGEFRTILLALKLLEMRFQNAEGEAPTLLLDDVFSELDHERQRFLLEQIKGFQTFIATTKDSAIINRERLLTGDFIEIHDGSARLI